MHRAGLRIHVARELAFDVYSWLVWVILGQQRLDFAGERNSLLFVALLLGKQ